MKQPKREYKKVVIQTVISSLKSEFKKADWWPEVQDDVRTRLEWIIDRIEQAGYFFSRTFMTLFRWEFERRQLEGKNVTNPMAGYLTTLLGMRISEEAFQCGSLPTRAVLHLYDYTAPNDADVTACMFLCHKIDTLTRAGLLRVREDKLAATQEEIGAAFQQVARRKKAEEQMQKPAEEESIKWDFEDESPDL